MGYICYCLGEQRRFSCTDYGLVSQFIVFKFEFYLQNYKISGFWMSDNILADWFFIIRSPNIKVQEPGTRVVYSHTRNR